MSRRLISWQPAQFFGGYVPTCTSNGVVACTISSGYRYVNIIVSSSGALTFSYNWWEIDQSDATVCNLQTWETSYLLMNYNGNIFEPQSIQGCTGTGYSNPAFADTNQDRSLLIPADGSGKVRIIYQYEGTNTAPSLMSTWYDGSSTGPTDT